MKAREKMYKYQKKPVVVEAFQMTEKRRWDNSEWPVWLHQAWNMELHEPGALFPSGEEDDTLLIITLEGIHVVSWDDWIIQEIQGEIYPCKPDIFVATYEKVPENRDVSGSLEGENEDE